MIQYDVAFIGSGHTTWHAAVALRQAGKSVVLIERDLVAGTCTNYGCDAKILLDGPSELMAQLKQYQGVGVDQTPDFNWEAFMAHKHQVIDALPAKMTTLFDQLGIDVIHGTGILMGNHMIQVGKQKIMADNIVLGTGQHAVKPDIPGKEFLHDSRDFLNLEHLPAHLTILGAGVIALEFAALVLQLGTRVTILSHGNRAAKGFAPRYVTKLLVKLQAAGADIRFNEPVKSVVQTTEGYDVTTESGFAVTTDYVLAATGRRANVDLLGLENAGIHSSSRGIVVDDHLRANGDNIYASGDVLDKSVPKLTPTATFESNYIAGQILGDTAPISYPAIPSVLFALPRIARVGVTAAVAAGNPDYRIVHLPYGKLFDFEYKNETDAELTAVIDRDNHLVGADIYGMDAPDLVNVLVLVINQKLTAAQLAKMIFAFPTPVQGVIDALLPALTPAAPVAQVRLDA